jgi:hypothetical protein
VRAEITQKLRDYAAAYRFLNTALAERIPKDLKDPFFPFWFISLNGELEELPDGTILSSDPAYFPEDWDTGAARATGDGDRRAYATLLRFLEAFIARGSTPAFGTFVRMLAPSDDGLPSDDALRVSWTESVAAAMSASDTPSLVALTMSPFIVRETP